MTTGVRCAVCQTIDRRPDIREALSHYVAGADLCSLAHARTPSYGWRKASPVARRRLVERALGILTDHIKDSAIPRRFGMAIGRIITAKAAQARNAARNRAATRFDNSVQGRYTAADLRQSSVKPLQVVAGGQAEETKRAGCEARLVRGCWTTPAADYVSNLGYSTQRSTRQPRQEAAGTSNARQATLEAEVMR